MHKYRVVSRSTEECRLTLRCSLGRYHQARVLSVLPLMNATLEGDRPHLGFGILIDAQSGSVHRLSFEAIGSTEVALPMDATPDPMRRPPSTGTGAPLGAA